MRGDLGESKVREGVREGGGAHVRRMRAMRDAVVGECMRGTLMYFTVIILTKGWELASRGSRFFQIENHYILQAGCILMFSD